MCYFVSPLPMPEGMIWRMEAIHFLFFSALVTSCLTSMVGDREAGDRPHSPKRPSK